MNPSTVAWAASRRGVRISALSARRQVETLPLDKVQRLCRWRRHGPSRCRNRHRWSGQGWGCRTATFRPNWLWAPIRRTESSDDQQHLWAVDPCRGVARIYSGMMMPIPTPRVASPNTTAPIGMKRMSGPAGPPAVRGAPPKKPPEMSSGATNRAIRIAHTSFSPRRD